jgi:hypothetical protein
MKLGSHTLHGSVNFFMVPTRGREEFDFFFLKKIMLGRPTTVLNFTPKKKRKIHVHRGAWPLFPPPLVSTSVHYHLNNIC